MTSEERNLVTELFDRLATLEDAPRDREAERMVQDGLRQAPNAPYALVQTVLVQDEALKRADARIRELEAAQGIGAEPQRQGGFLDSMRDSVWGRRDTPRAGSVPTVRPGGAMGTPAGYSSETPPMSPAPMAPTAGSGGSFLGTAAATAAGVIGGSLLLNSMRSMMGGGHGGSAHAAVNPPSGGSSPWSTDSSAGGGSGDLARQAGLDDISRGHGGRGDTGSGRGHGIADSDATGAAEGDDARHLSDNDQDFDDTDEGDLGGDSGGDDQ